MNDSCKHRLLAIFCSLQAWQRQIDGIIIDRVPLLSYLGLERLKRDRVDWIARDFEPWFRYHDHYTSSDYGEWESELTFARVPITDSSDASVRIKTLNLPKAGLRAETLWRAITDMLLGFNEPLAEYGFNELKRPDPFAGFRQTLKEVMENPARFGLPPKTST